jgi:hypothetical protein
MRMPGHDAGEDAAPGNGGIATVTRGSVFLGGNTGCDDEGGLPSVNDGGKYVDEEIAHDDVAIEYVGKET